MTTHIQLRPYQEETVHALVRDLKNGENPLAVLPTGTGKSVIIASLCQRLTTSPENRILVLTHSSELVKQDAAKISIMCQNVSRGVHAAGLGLKDKGQQVITGTIQSVSSTLSRDPDAFGVRQLIIIDEAHLLSTKENSMYRTCIKTLMRLCPSLKVAGFSATPFRLDSGHLVEQDNAIFSTVSIDYTASIPEFINAGWLAPLVSPPVPIPVTIDVEGKCMTGGKLNKKTRKYTPKRIDDSKVEMLLGNEKLLAQACDAMVDLASMRKSWLVFVTGITNADAVSKLLNERGVSTEAVNSSMTKEHNDSAIRRFRAGELRCLVSANQLTTGFDVPQVDMIGVLRPTDSTSLHIQMLGRGLRPSPGKVDCLVMDFAENLRRLGPINDPKIKDKSKEERLAFHGGIEEGEVYVEGEFQGKEIKCNECGLLYVTSEFDNRCPRCGAIPPQKLDLENFTDNVVIKYDISLEPQLPYGLYKVLNMVVQHHKSRSGSDCLRLTVSCESRKTSKPFNSFFYMSFDRTGEAYNRASYIWSQFNGSCPIPRSTMEAYSRIGELRQPRAIGVKKGHFKGPQKFDELTGVLY